MSLYYTLLSLPVSLLVVIKIVNMYITLSGI